MNSLGIRKKDKESDWKLIKSIRKRIFNEHFSDCWEPSFATCGKALYANSTVHSNILNSEKQWALCVNRGENEKVTTKATWTAQWNQKWNERWGERAEWSSQPASSHEDGVLILLICLSFQQW